MPTSSKYAELTDEDLVHRYRNSYDNAYIGELYTRYTHIVYAVCLKYLRNEADAKDAVMQIFEKLITDLRKHHVTVFRPWLHTVVRNYCMMEFRKSSVLQKNDKQFKAETGIIVEMQPEEHLDEEKFSKEDIEAFLKDGIAELKDEQKQCVELFYLSDKSYKEIMELTGYSFNDVKSYVQNGKRNLKNYITKRQHEKR